MDTRDNPSKCEEPGEIFPIASSTNAKFLRMIMKNKKNPGVIVIGDHIQALGIIQSLGRRDVPVYLMNHESLCISRFSRFCKKFIKCPDLFKDGDPFITFLLDFARRHAVTGWILIPTNDRAVYLLSRNREALSEFYQVAVPAFEVLQFSYDKQKTYDVAKNAGIPVPKTICPQRIEDLHQLLSDFIFPVIIKGREGYHFYKKMGRKAIRCSSIKELMDYYRSHLSLIDPAETIIQEIIPGKSDQVHSFCSFIKTGRFLGVWMGKKIREHPPEFGTATVAMSENIHELGELGLNFLASINFYGVSEIEFKKDSRDGKYKIIEMNARHWLWHSLAIHCGVDFPYLLYQDLTGGSVECQTSFKTNAFWIHLYTDLPYGLLQMFRGTLSLKEFIKPYTEENQLAVFAWDDPLPIIMETILLPYLWIVR